MKKTVLLTAVVAAALCAHSATLSLDGTWEFSKNGGAFEKVTVPHDWAIAGPFNPEAPCGSGKLPWQGYGEYRRTFTAAKAEKAFLVFDGVMAWPEVFLNGKKVGGWDFGYMSFRCDVTDALKDGENEVVVKADTRPHQSRWYPGGGLYRSVRLETFKLTDADPETVVITTSGVAEGRRGEPGEKTTDATAVVHFSYETFDGRKVAFDQHVHNPVLWSDVTPHLYEYELCGRIYRYGIRTIEWTADDGFHLNGRRVQIKGFCFHQDLGSLGSAKLMKVDDDVSKWLGITLLPQAGVALGMSITASSLEVSGVLIRNIVLFSVLIYELVGPLLTKIALTRTGDIAPMSDEVKNRRSRMYDSMKAAKNGKAK